MKFADAQSMQDVMSVTPGFNGWHGSATPPPGYDHIMHPAAASPSNGAQITGDNSDNLWKVFAMAGGIPAGFLGMKALYDKYKDHEMNGQIDKSKNKYQAQLMSAQPKVASETPCVDSFCTAVAEELNKAANEMPMSISPEQAQAFTHSPLIQQALDDKYRSSLLGAVKGVGNNLTGDSGSVLRQGMLGLGILGTTGVLGAAISANNRKRDKETSSQYPTRVVYGA